MNLEIQRYFYMKIIVTIIPILSLKIAPILYLSFLANQNQKQESHFQQVGVC